MKYRKKTWLAEKILEICRAARLKVFVGAVQVMVISENSGLRLAKTKC